MAGRRKQRRAALPPLNPAPHNQDDLLVIIEASGNLLEDPAVIGKYGMLISEKLGQEKGQRAMFPRQPSIPYGTWVDPNQGVQPQGQVHLITTETEHPHDNPRLLNVDLPVIVSDAEQGRSQIIRENERRGSHRLFGAIILLGGVLVNVFTWGVTPHLHPVNDLVRMEAEPAPPPIIVQYDPDAGKLTQPTPTMAPLEKENAGDASESDTASPETAP